MTRRIDSQLAVILTIIAALGGAASPCAAQNFTTDVSIKTGDTPLLTLEQDASQVQTPYEWKLAANESNFFVFDAVAGTSPFVIESGAPSNRLIINADGNIGIGAGFPEYIGINKGSGRFLNFLANGDTVASGVANMVVQGNLGGQFHLVHRNAPANQRILRFQCSSGSASFHVLNDSLATYAVSNALTIKMSNGNIGLKVASPSHPLHLASGAHCTAGGVWTNASSRDLKQNIEPITSERARATVRALQPVGYQYKSEPNETYVGFIAEDVPDLVATNDRKSLASMDITAVLTRVVQDQDRRQEDLQQTVAQQQEVIKEQQQALAQQQSLLVSLNKRLAELEHKSNDMVAEHRQAVAASSNTLK